MEETVKHSGKLSKRFKRALGILFALFFAISAGLIIYSRKIEPMVSARIKEAIYTATDGLYTISFSEIHLNPFTGTVRLDDIQFTANESVYFLMRKKGIQPTHIYSIAVKSLALRRIHPIKVYFNKDLVIKTVHINNPTIRVSYRYPKKEKAEAEDKRTAWQRLSKYLKSIRIGEIVFDNIDFQYTDWSLGKPEIDGVKNMSVRIEDLLIDSLSQNDKSRFYFTKEIFVRVRKHEYLSRDKMYTILFDDLKISTSDRYAWAKGIKIIPRYGEMEYSKLLPTRKAQYKVDLNEVLLSNIDIKRLTDKRQLRASSLNFLNADASIFMDKSKARPTYDRGWHFPQLALKRLRLNTLIDTVNVFNSTITYREYDPLTARAGKIFFNNVNGSVYNFTNDTLTLQKKKWIRARCTSRIFGKARLDFFMNLNLASKTEEYNYSGSLGSMNAKYFNQLSRPLALLKINSGKISKVNFSVNADYRKSSGKLLMFYRGLNIGLLRIDSGKMIHTQMLRSLVANNLLLKEANPSIGEKPRIGYINYTRPDSIAFFGSIWQSLYSGLRETMGLTPEREQKLKDQFKSLANQSGNKGKLRKLKRSLRRQSGKK